MQGAAGEAVVMDDDDVDDPADGPDPEPLALPDALPIALVDESLPASKAPSKMFACQKQEKCMLSGKAKASFVTSSPDTLLRRQTH